MAVLAPHFDPDVFAGYAHGVEPSPLKASTYMFTAPLGALIDGLADEFDGGLDKTIDRAQFLVPRLDIEAAFAKPEPTRR